MGSMRRAALIGAAVVAAGLVGLSSPGWAHSGGRIQLFVDRLNLHPVAGNDWTVSVSLVDADSGSPAPGFDVSAEAAGPAVTLTDAGGGRYTGSLTAPPGEHDVAIRAETLPGGPPGVPLRKVYSLDLEPGKDVGVGATAPGRSASRLFLPVASALATAAIIAWFLVGRRRRSAVVAVALAGIALHGAARPAQAQTQSAVKVTIERSDKVGQTPLWIPVRVTVTEGDGTKPLAVDHLVFAGARNSRGDQAGPFTLGPLEANDPTVRGIHQGFVIVPYGGPWTITAVVNTAQDDERARTTLGRGSTEMTVDAPVQAAGAGGAPAGTGGGRPQSEPLGVAVLWIHTVFAVGWFAAIGLLALLALPTGRRFLSEYGTNRLDGHLATIARATWWLTGLVVGTGIYNMVKSVAYRVPLSPDQVTRLFRLPYAKPYYLSLFVKLAMYAVMIGATVPLIREAHRQATLDETDSIDLATDDHSPWEDPDRAGGDGPAGGGRVALRSKRAAVAGDDIWSQTQRSQRQGPARARLPVGIMVIGGAVIMAAVTLLKYFHLLGELSRLAG
jgi:hypothetical protein